MQQSGIDRGLPSSHLPAQAPEDMGRGSIMEAKRIKALNQLRHKAMVDDAAKLLLLAQELNDDSANVSPAERLRKAAEIERLTKSVKEKMTYTVGNDQLSPPFSTMEP